jgi:hypothetical protein
MPDEPALLYVADQHFGKLGMAADTRLSGLMIILLLVSATDSHTIQIH